MAYKRFRLNCIIRVSVLAASTALFFFLLFQTRLYAAVFLLGLMLVYQTYALFHYVEKTNRDLARFFESVKYGDFSQTFKDKEVSRGSSFDELRSALANVTDAFRKTRVEKEEHYRYLQTVVQHVGVGLIAFQEDGEVEIINTAAKKMLGVPQLRNIHFLESLSKPLVEAMLQLKPKEKALVKIEEAEDLLHLALYATEFKLGGRAIKLVSIQNIQSELEEKEIEAWQKLIRVLTHEIMNSITPVASLASTISALVKATFGKQVAAGGEDAEALIDIDLALQTIQKRSQGLLHFVDAYRNLTRIPKPDIRLFPVRELFARVEKLMQAHIVQKSIEFHVLIEPQNIEFTADPELIEQVLINLLLNALQAVEGRDGSRIELIARLDGRGREIIQVKDNGPGIPKENLEKIFIPFFSTKEGGSGIGLSLSRQIMRLHRGSITVHSKPDMETTFILRF